MESKTVDRDAVLNSLALNNSTSDGQPRKRKRLDNLTAEERALRRKLKNRVAAQTARDRKKARMTELEEMVAQLEKENKALRLSNESLRKHSETVEIENSELRVRLGLTPPVSPEPVNHTYPQSPEPTLSKPSSVVIKKETECNEYAAGTPDSVSLSDHDMDDDQQQFDMGIGFFEIDEAGESLLQPKQEGRSCSTSCQYGDTSATEELVHYTDDESVPQSSSDLTVEDLVGIECDGFDSLDDLLNLKDFSKEFKPLDAEPEMLGCEMWEETFTDVLFPSLLAV